MVIAGKWGKTLYVEKDGNNVVLKISTGTGCDMDVDISQSDALLLRDKLNSFIKITQHFNRGQRLFVIQSAETWLYLRDDGKNWTLNIELAHVFLTNGDKLNFDFDLDNRTKGIVDELIPVEIIPKANGTKKFNIKG